MTRVKGGFASKRRHKKILKHAKGYRGARSKLFRTALVAVQRAWKCAYKDRKTKKREFRKLWIQRINAAVRERGMSYSAFMNGLKKTNISLDRKQLAHLAIVDSQGFDIICDKVRASL